MVKVYTTMRTERIFIIVCVHRLYSAAFDVPFRIVKHRRADYHILP